MTFPANLTIAALLVGALEAGLIYWCHKTTIRRFTKSKRRR